MSPQVSDVDHRESDMSLPITRTRTLPGTAAVVGVRGEHPGPRERIRAFRRHLRLHAPHRGARR